MEISDLSNTMFLYFSTTILFWLSAILRLEIKVGGYDRSESKPYLFMKNKLHALIKEFLIFLTVSMVIVYNTAEHKLDLCLWIHWGITLVYLYSVHCRSGMAIVESKYL